MTLRHGRVSVTILAVCILTGCETTEPKKTPASVPAQANAPAVTAPLAQKSEHEHRIQEDLAPKPDPVETLLAAAEKQYQAGQASYQAGHLEQAKENFNQAFNTLLSSNLDVRNDDRLEREF